MRHSVERAAKGEAKMSSPSDFTEGQVVFRKKSTLVW